MNRAASHLLIARRVFLSLLTFAAIAFPLYAQGPIPKQRVQPTQFPIKKIQPGQVPGNPIQPKDFPIKPVRPVQPNQPIQPIQPGPLPISPVNPVQPGGPSSPNNDTLGVFGNFTPKGMFIQRVVPGSAGERAGLKPGDLVMKVDNMVITNQNQLDQAIQTSGGLLQMIVLDQTGQMNRVIVDVSGAGFGRIRAPYLLGLGGSVTIQGFQVRKVYTNSPAANAGIRVGDFIVGINQQPVTSDQEYFRLLSESTGRAVVSVRRAGQVSHLNVRLQLYQFGTLGEYFPTGCRVEVVAPFTPAANAGLKPGDRILRLDNVNVNSQQAFEQAVNLSGGSVIAQVQRGVGGVGQVQVNVVNNSLGCWAEPAAGAMRILTVNQNQLAQRIGLVRGDMILRVNRQPTQNLQQLQTALENARGLLVLDVRFGQTGQVGRLFVDLGI